MTMLEVTTERPRSGRHPKSNKTTRYGNGWGQGIGWGGPARGCGQGSRARLTPGLSREKRALGAERRQRKEAASEALQDTLYDLAMHGRTGETRLGAACRLLDMLLGPPVRRTVTLQVDDLAHLSDAELRAEIERLRESDALPNGVNNGHA